MESKFQISVLLELSATDDIEAFKIEVEQKGCDVNEAGFWYCRQIGSKNMCYEKRTPLMVASLFGSTRVVKYIIQTNMVDVNKQTGSENVTALHCALAGGSESTLEIVKLLVDAGADVDCLDESIKQKLSVANSKELVGSEKKEYPIDITLPDINNGVFGTDEFRMYSFKVKTCSRSYSHDWTQCPFVHPGENARRRDPKKYLYSCVPCPEFRKGTCQNKDACEYSHGVFESLLHPLQYRTRLCKDEVRCSRKVCFFAHKHEELRPLYASTGSAMPSQESLPISNVSTPHMSPLVAASSPNSGNLWQNEINLTPNRQLKSALSARDLYQEMDRLHSASMQPLTPSQLQSMSRLQLNQNRNHVQASYPINNFVSSPVRKSSALGFDSSAAMAAAVMNSRSSAFATRSQSFMDRGVARHHISASESYRRMNNGFSDWISQDRDDLNKLKKSATFGVRNTMACLSQPECVEPDVSWVHSLVSSESSEIFGAEKQHYNLYKLMSSPWAEQIVA
ncbi:zinc finger CCCH domain-containing protein 29-like [Vicia villosa]|uniref:zinc finger CCCH domain-containing protein 29-like n=1 Tax=Vicia villosa TaxID=3911 RepID=UPI00273BF2A0|nr:zinc finger CCCH domain-containing protein 29-like [Vicia villosa]